MSNVSSSNSHKEYIPKLRFKGFTDSWSTATLGELGTFTKGAPLSKADISAGGTPFILYGELYTTYKEVANQIVRKTQKTADNECLSRIGDVIIPTSGETPEEIATATCVMIPDVILAGDLNIYRNNTIDGRIVSYIINHVVNADISRIAQGKSVVHIKADELAKIQIHYPTKSEQTKLLNFLLLLDAKIEKQKILVERIKSYKRGLLYAIFNGKIALTQNEHFEYESVENLFKVIPDKQFQIQTHEYKNEGDFDVVDQGKLDIVAHSNNKSRLFTDLPIIIFGDHTTNIKYRTKPFIIGGDGVKLLKCKPNNNPCYLYYTLQQYNVKQEGYKRHYSILKNVKLPIMSNASQNKIAIILEKIDSYIMKQTNILGAIINLKTALLQKLFI